MVSEDDCRDVAPVADIEDEVSIWPSLSLLRIIGEANFFSAPDSTVADEEVEALSTEDFFRVLEGTFLPFSTSGPFLKEVRAISTSSSRNSLMWFLTLILRVFSLSSKEMESIP